MVQSLSPVQSSGIFKAARALKMYLIKRRGDILRSDCCEETISIEWHIDDRNTKKTPKTSCIMIEADGSR